MSQRHSKQDEANSRQLAATAPPSLKVIIMNTRGNVPGAGFQEKRIKAIQQIFLQERPHLILFQEFAWNGTTSLKWRTAPIPKNYESPEQNGSIITYDKNELIQEGFTEKELQAPLDELIRIGKIPNGFAPRSRMYIRKFKTKGVPHMEFICVSWHGPHNGKKDAEKQNDFRNLQLYLMEISTRNKNMPLIVGGDFNIDIHKIEDFVIEGLELYSYIPTARRRGKVIDFYLNTDSLIVENIQPFDFGNIIVPDADPLHLFDHDPVVANLRNADVH